VYFSVHDAKVRLVPAPSGQADVSISGTPGAFTRIVRSGFDPSVFRDGSLTLEGDPETVADLKTLLGALDLDAEEALAQVLGDTLAWRTKRLMGRGCLATGRPTRQIRAQPTWQSFWSRKPVCWPAGHE